MNSAKKRLIVLVAMLLAIAVILLAINFVHPGLGSGRAGCIKSLIGKKVHGGVSCPALSDY